MTSNASPAAMRAIAIAQIRGLMVEHSLTLSDLAPPTFNGLVDLDAIKADGLNSNTESERLLAAHRAQEIGEL
jgi:hypothetical protein